MKKLFILAALFPLFVHGQSTGENYVKTTTYREASSGSPKYDITYFDGLGRPIEQVAHKQSATAQDIVTPITYDAFGRQAREYLPIVSGSTLNYHGVTPADVDIYYGTAQFPTMATTTTPYSEKLFESSPLNRILKQASPGDSWKMGAGHEIRFDYQPNEAKDKVKLFGVTTSWDATNEVYDTAITDNGEYPDNTLYKTITRNENWQNDDGTTNTTEEFKDKEGRVILKRTFGISLVNGSPVNESHDTYYVYDDYGNLTYVIPPIVDVNNSIELNGLCYQYKYDSRNRLIEKKLPGKGWEFIVYNNQDMPVATGPALNPWGLGTQGWMITKYDAFGRVVYTGWYDGIVPDAAGRKTFQDNMGTSWAEERAASVTIDSVPVNYTNVTYPTEFKLLTINYYDSYSNPYAADVPSTVEEEPVLTVPKGMPTTSWIRVLTAQDEETAERITTFYDLKGRVIRTVKGNNYLGGHTINDAKLDFTGRAEYTISKHKYTGSSSYITVKDIYEYTDQDRLLVHKHKINNLPEQLIAKNEYDPLGQLISKQVGGNDVTTYVGLQKVDYRYNIRGWLTDINKADDLGEISNPDDLFAFRINYDISDDEIVPALFNGNIAETFWRSSTDNVLRKYSYKYDGLNRLRIAMYQKPNTAGVTNMYDEQMEYDKNGNIQYLHRNGDFDADSPSGTLPIDELTYTYDHDKQNRLMRVQDATTVTLGFKDDNTTGTDPDDDYAYDDFGNMVSDTNKSIESISYNHLNLPVEINFVGGDKIRYLYNALGQKVRKTVTESSDDTVTDYLDGYQYTDGTISFFAHAEGYVNVIQCSECLVKYRFNYVFNYLDHLGNIRMSYTADPQDPQELSILEENHYYPFGLKHTNYNAGSKEFQKKEGFPELTELEEVLDYYDMVYKYKYNGKEWQDELGLNVYDYGMTLYDPALGRRNNIDPLAEKSRRWSPYSYCFNNPLLFIDPDGMWPYPVYIRSYISSGSVAGGTFRGDGRGPSTDVSRTTTSRVTQSYTVDPTKGKVTDKSTTAGYTMMNGISTGNPLTPIPPMIDKAVPGKSYSATNTKNSSGNNITTVSSSYTAKDPITPSLVTPEIDMHSTVSLSENSETGTLSVSASIAGDSFPSTEAFIKDGSGLGVFIGASQEQGGLLDLYGDNRNELINTSFQITTDGKGNFTGVKQNDKTYSIEDWNKQFTKQ